MSDIVEGNADEAAEMNPRDKRRRIPTRKGFQNTLVEKTSAFNKETKSLQNAIRSVHLALSQTEVSKLKSAATQLEKNKQLFETSCRDLQRLFVEDRWDETADVESVVRETSQTHIHHAEAALSEAAKKISTETEVPKETSSRSSQRTSLGKSRRSFPSHTPSSTSARMQAMAEAAGARQQAEYDLLIAEKENIRSQREAQEERDRATAKAQHDRDMAVLAAKKLTAVADAKLNAIEQSILNEISPSSVDEETSVISTQRTESWVQKQQNTVPDVNVTTRRIGVRFDDQQRSQSLDPYLETKQEAENYASKSLPQHDPTYSYHPQHNSTHLPSSQNPGDHDPASVVEECLEAVVTTNDKLTASLGRLSLPKCHPDLFSGDATMYYPWKSSFKGMISECDITAEQEMNYLHMYTRGPPQKLVDTFRRRLYGNSETLLKGLWAELEKRFGNVAILTNSLLARLKEAAKFSERDRKSLQTFSDLCTDVSSQIDQLPGLACLDYPHTIRPILYSLPPSIRSKWEKEVVKFAVKNADAYPKFHVFASEMRRQSTLRNHPNVTATDIYWKGKEKPKFDDHHTVLKGETEIERQEDGEKYCTFHAIKGHKLQECKAFERKTLQEKMEWLKQAGHCFRCLVPKHVAKNCKANIKCNKCGSTRHLETLHMEKKKKEDDKEDDVKSVRTNVKRQSISRVSCSKILPLDVFHRNRPNHVIRVYALIDEQSNASMISPQLTDELGIVGPKEKYFLSTCSGSKETRYGQRVHGLVVKSMKGLSIDLPTLLECDNIPRDKHEIPTPELIAKFDHLKDIAKEIPPLDTKAEVHLLIGRDSPELMKVLEFRNGPEGTPWAHRLAIGWTICGEVCLNREGGPVHVRTHRTVYLDSSCREIEGGVAKQPKVNSNSLHEVVHHEYFPCPNKFDIHEPRENMQNYQDIFQITDYDNEQSMSVEDQRFLRIMETGVHKNQLGNWEMPLPLRKTNVTLPNNRCQATRRTNNLLTTFKRKPETEEDYFQFMEKLLQRGHAVPVPSTKLTKTINESGKVWYLPHFGVYHPRKPGKIRVVFDSSAEFHGASLNKELLSGPDTLNSLLGILVRFRKNYVAVACDIEQMFHNFHVNPEHQDLLRFLWFENNDKTKDVIEYQMTVHLFGNTSSPAVATFGLRKTAEDGEEEFGHDAKEFACNDFYVDDGLTSRSKPDEAVNLVKSTQAMLATANLRLCKIASNSVDVMEALPPEDRLESIQNLDLQQDPLPSQRSLGVMWNLQKDALTFSISLPKKPFTRRGVLSIINSIYDPLGFATPATLPGRLLLRQLTTSGNEKAKNESLLGWDDPLPSLFWTKWHNWTTALKDLQDILIPRCYLPEHSNEIKRAEIHAFSDASYHAIGIAVYLKLINQANDVKVSLVFAQAKLAPKRATTIPRLELCAAVLAAKAVKWLTRELKLNIDEIIFYTDSKVVLGYIQNESRRFYVYVANRIQIIRSITEPSQWRYVESIENPADIATRGKPAKHLMESSWFEGPEFLKNIEQFEITTGEINANEFSVDDNDPEIRVTVTQLHETKSLGSDRFIRFSNWNTLRRAIANLLIKVKTWKTRSQSSTPQMQNDDRNQLTLPAVGQLPRNPSAAELGQSEIVMIKSAQREAYAEEITALQSSQDTVSPKSSLYSLDPFLDQDGILRVGGRLKQADQMFQEKHPAIIPKGCHLAKLAITHHHNVVHHQGRQITHGAVRQAGLWIVGAKRTVSKLISRCITCRKLRGKLMTQHMADLPSDRLETPPPFTNVGFDVFGPWQIRTPRLRGGAANSKRWGLVFTCLNSRAIHIEVLETMTSSSFICALRRFFAIRGPPSLLRCDRGTNFIGAKSELDKALKEMNQKMIAKYTVEQNCEWIFNPPHASHFGGIWERQINTIRRVLDGMFINLGPSQLSHELLVTLMAEVTGIVNSRPISTVPSDADQPQPLTPNMLLTMKTRPLISPPGVFTSLDLYSRRHWKRAQYLADQFWARWKNEYLQNQQRRSKWNERHQDLAVGDIVIMKDEAHRSEWPLGRVVDAIKSDKDGLVRKATITCWKEGEKKSYLRPISQLVYIMST